jgi:hypothetical protein
MCNWLPIRGSDASLSPTEEETDQEMSDWRLLGQEEYLFGVSLSKKVYKKPRDDWDHDHCEFCFAKFSERENDLHEGYTTEDEYRWICERCYRDFKDQFQWHVKDDKEEGKRGDERA